MSKRVEIKCDMCGNIIEEEYDNIYVRFSRAIGDNQETTTAYDLCPECCRAVTDFIEQYEASDSDDENREFDVTIEPEMVIDHRISTLKNFINSYTEKDSKLDITLKYALELMKRELAISRYPHDETAIAIKQLSEYRSDIIHKKVPCKVLRESTIEICIDAIKKDCHNCKRVRNAYDRGFSHGMEE